MLIGIDGNEANIKEKVGSNVYAFELIQAISKLTHDLTIYLKNLPLEDLPKQLRYRVIPPKFLWTQWRLPLDLYFHKPKPDIFFTPGHYAPRISPIPTVISILDLSFLEYPDSFQPAVLRQLKNWTKHSALKAAHIFTISNYSKQEIIKYYQIPDDKITVTYPGINNRFRQDVSDNTVKNIKSKYKITGKYIFTLATKQPKKNLPRLIEATKSISSINLIIAGKTWNQFSRSAIQPSSNVLELGYVSNEDIPALMKGAEAFVLPSLYEGFGIPVAEAMAVGVPVVVSNNTSLPEVVGTAGIMVDPADVHSIARGITQALAKRVQLIKSGQQQARQFTWENCARQTLEVLYGFSVERPHG